MNSTRCLQSWEGNEKSFAKVHFWIANYSREESRNSRYYFYIEYCLHMWKPFRLAPGSYQTERLNIRQTPSYSFGVKVTQTKVDDSPCKSLNHLINIRKIPTFLYFFWKAPCAYTPEKARSQSSPKYSFGVKHAKDKFNITPGNVMQTYLLFALYLLFKPS